MAVGGRSVALDGRDVTTTAFAGGIASPVSGVRATALVGVAGSSHGPGTRGTVVMSVDGDW